MRYFEYILILIKSAVFLAVISGLFIAGPLIVFYRLSGETWQSMEQTPFFEDPRTYIVVGGFGICMWILWGLYEKRGGLLSKVGEWISRGWKIT